MVKAKSTVPRERKNLPLNLVTAVLTEAGYRCAVPTCRNILALDMHHIWEVNAGGPNTLANLIALCPTCHALYHRGTIQKESIYAWKEMLVAIGRAFDVGAIDQLMFLSIYPRDEVAVSGDGILGFGRLIAAGLVSYRRIQQPDRHEGPSMSEELSIARDMSAGFPILYLVDLTRKGRQLVEGWKKGDRQSLQTALSGPATQPN
jgi:hypothetical protein